MSSHWICFPQTLYQSWKKMQTSTEDGAIGSVLLFLTP